MHFKTKNEIKKCLQIEKQIYYPGGGSLPFSLREKDILWSFIKTLRKLEYYEDMNYKIAAFIYKIRYRKLSLKYSLHIPPHVCEIGLDIAHIGPIVINSDSRIGKNCRIHVGVNIGANGGKSPQIGDNVYIGPGAKIFGDIIIADNIKIGANAVVNKTCSLEGAVLVGVPAKAHVN